MTPQSSPCKEQQQEGVEESQETCSQKPMSDDTLEEKLPKLPPLPPASGTKLLDCLKKMDEAAPHANAANAEGMVELSLKGYVPEQAEKEVPEVDKSQRELFLEEAERMGGRWGDGSKVWQMWSSAIRANKDLHAHYKSQGRVYSKQRAFRDAWVRSRCGQASEPISGGNGQTFV